MRYTYSVTLPGTRVTESDSGEPEDDLSELVRSGYNTIYPSAFDFQILSVIDLYFRFYQLLIYRTSSKAIHMSFEEAIKDLGCGIILDIEVTPGSRSISVPSGYNEWRKRIEVKLTKNAQKGKANDQLIECLATLFGISTSDILISSGATSSKKSVLVKSISYSKAVSVLAANLEK